MFLYLYECGQEIEAASEYVAVILEILHKNAQGLENVLPHMLNRIAFARPKNMRLDVLEEGVGLDLQQA